MRSVFSFVGRGAAKKQIGAVLCACLGVLCCGLASAQTPIMLGLGDSLGEGVQSADANLRTQPFTYLSWLAHQMGIPFRLPLIQSNPFGIVGDTTLRSRLCPRVSAFNLAVSGADVDSMLRDRADAASVEEIDSETDLVLFPRLGSQVEIAERLEPPFIICWIGNNDVLSAVISFDQLDASQMTSVEDFEHDFNEIVSRLEECTEVVVFANIPDVTNIGFLVDREDLIRFLDCDFGLAQGDYTSIVVMFLIKLGLDDGSLLEDPDYVLDATEVREIVERIETFNEIIQTAVAEIGMPVVHIREFFDDVVENPPVYFGIPLTPRFLGGIFSLDGVHPSNIAHALIANKFIETINSHFQICIPPISQETLEIIFLTDPFVDKDGDGRVRGRFGAGLLETVGPSLGISGDMADFIPDGCLPSMESLLGEQSIQQMPSPQEEDQQMPTVLDKNEIMEAFKQMLGLRPFDK